MGAAASEPRLGTGSMIRTMLGMGGVSVEIDRDAHDNYCVTVHGQRSGWRGCAETLTLAVRRAYEDMTRNEPITALHAAQRARVRLPDGGLGVLTRVSTESRRATVLTDEGRWRHLPLISLALYPTTNPEGAHDEPEAETPSVHAGRTDPGIPGGMHPDDRGGRT